MIAKDVARVLRLLFVAYVVATAVHIGLVMYHEPFAFDAWNVAQDTHAEPFSFERFFAYIADQYTSSNPRIGQSFTYLAYKLEFFAVIAPPIAYLALALALFVLGTGRWPSWKRGRDLALYALAIGCAWFAIPRIGMIMFCRAYGANYLYGATIQLWYLVPLRLYHGERRSAAATVGYFFAGVAAGMCNEHTGPTLCVFALAHAVWWHRRLDDRPNFLWAGAFGTVIGFAAVFFAPGQGQRYEGLATKVSILARIFNTSKDLQIIHDFVSAAGPLLGLIVIAQAIGKVRVVEASPEALIARRKAWQFVGLALAAGALITMTVFASPKLGPRFYLHACALLLAGYIGVADAVLVTAKRLAPFVVLGVLASAYAFGFSVPLYTRLHDQSDARLAALDATKPGGVFTAEGYEQVEDSWWFLGDDFRDIKKRELIARYYGLRQVIFRGGDASAPLGVTDVRLVPRYDVEPPSCLDEHGGLDLVGFRGLDVASIHKSMLAGIDALRARIGKTGKLRRLELDVQFAGAPPELPRKRLLVARWWPDAFEGWAGAIRREGHSTTREVVLPKELKGKPFEIFIYQIGGEWRRLGTTNGEPLEYTPWKRGAYWALACRPDECFVIVATRQL